MNFGAAEFITLAVLGLLIFGPRKLPEIARMAGRAMRELRSVTQDLKQELEAGLNDPPKSSAGTADGQPTTDDFPRPGPR
jgi:sec-independent protein translocase protein TatA